MHCNTEYYRVMFATIPEHHQHHSSVSSFILTSQIQDAHNGLVGHCVEEWLERGSVTATGEIWPDHTNLQRFNTFKLSNNNHKAYLSYGKF